MSEVETLYAYCRRRGISRTSASRYLAEKGLPTDQGVTAAVKTALEDKYPVQPEPIAVEVMPTVERSTDLLSKYQPQALTFNQYRVPDRGAMTLAAMRSAVETIVQGQDQEDNFVAAVIAKAQQQGQQLGAIEFMTLIQAKEQSRQAMFDQAAKSSGLMGNDPNAAADGGGL